MTMNIDIRSLHTKISQLKAMVAKAPVHPEAPEEIKHILKAAPLMLQNIEDALRVKGNNPKEFKLLKDMLDQAETFIDWAVGTVTGITTLETIKSGKGTDPSLATDQRLLNRIIKFMTTKIDGPTYLTLVREFAGEDAVQGETVYMDPGEEVEAFSQWMIHDINLPGESQCLIELFAKSESGNLPADELDLLVARLADRPSIYKVVKKEKDQSRGLYLVQDLLAPDFVLRIRDKATSQTLVVGSIFMARAIPIDAKDHLYSLMGKIASYPEKLWAILAAAIDGWSREYFEKNQKNTAQDFFRTHHARLRQEIRNIVEQHS